MKTSNLKPQTKELIDWDHPIEKNRAWHITVYDLQGGPVHHEALDKLEKFASKIAKEYNLTIERKVE